MGRMPEVMSMACGMYARGGDDNTWSGCWR